MYAGLITNHSCLLPYLYPFNPPQYSDYLRLQITGPGISHPAFGIIGMDVDEIRGIVNKR